MSSIHKKKKKGKLIKDWGGSPGKKVKKRSGVCVCVVLPVGLGKN